MIKIICIGKIKEKYLTEMINDYKKRVNKYHKLEIIEILDSNILDESNKIISKFDKSYKVALTLKGKKMSSIEFADFIDLKLMNFANITFIIGGSNGLDKSVLSKVDDEISFGDMTFPHGLFRGILLEQIYRAFKIIKNETYHK